jgi:hypothetical protein
MHLLLNKYKKNSKVELIFNKKTQILNGLKFNWCTTWNISKFNSFSHLLVCVQGKHRLTTCWAKTWAFNFLEAKARKNEEMMNLIAPYR